MDSEIPSSVIYNDSHVSSTMGSPDRRIWISVFLVLLAVAYCLGHYLLGHLQPVHFVFSALLLGLFFASSTSRIFMILAIPFVLKDMSFDAIRYVPFEWLKPIHVAGPYRLEMFLFGVPSQGHLLLFNEYLLRFLHPALDFLAAAVYFLNEPVAILFILLFWKISSKELAERYATAFLIMNLFAFATYVFLPVAPPWFVAKYGLISPTSPVLGDPAGLIRFDHMIHWPFAERIYNMSPVVFGAIPSMHAGFSMLGWIYSFRTNWKWVVVIGAYSLFMWFSALYLQHHYVIDLIVGIFYAFLTYGIVEFLASGLIGRIYRFLWKHLVQEGPRPFWG